MRLDRIIRPSELERFRASHGMQFSLWLVIAASSLSPFFSALRCFQQFSAPSVISFASPRCFAQRACTTRRTFSRRSSGFNFCAVALSPRRTGSTGAGSLRSTHYVFEMSLHMTIHSGRYENRSEFSVSKLRNSCAITCTTRRLRQDHGAPVTSHERQALGSAFFDNAGRLKMLPLPARDIRCQEKDDEAETS